LIQRVNFLYEAFNFCVKNEALFIFIIFQLKMHLFNQIIKIIEFDRNLEEQKYADCFNFIDYHNYRQYFNENEYFWLQINFINLTSFAPQNWDAQLLNC
jgi:hypothetical protein